jgi:hypothetical protein
VRCPSHPAHGGVQGASRSAPTRPRLRPRPRVESRYSPGRPVGSTSIRPDNPRSAWPWRQDAHVRRRTSRAGCRSSRKAVVRARRPERYQPAVYEPSETTRAAVPPDTVPRGGNRGSAHRRFVDASGLASAQRPNGHATSVHGGISDEEHSSHDDQVASPIGATSTSRSASLRRSCARAIACYGPYLQPVDMRLTRRAGHAYCTAKDAVVQPQYLTSIEVPIESPQFLW